MIDQIADKGRDEQESMMNHLVAEQLISSLGEVEQKLIRLRFYQDKTQTEVAKILGFSQVQVSRMEKKILLGLRERIN
jgi:RNA polymerase sporulation-specific sigma factor